MREQISTMSFITQASSCTAHPRRDYHCYVEMHIKHHTSPSSHLQGCSSSTRHSLDHHITIRHGHHGTFHADPPDIKERHVISSPLWNLTADRHHCSTIKLPPEVVYLAPDTSKNHHFSTHQHKLLLHIINPAEMVEGRVSTMSFNCQAKMRCHQWVLH